MQGAPRTKQRCWYLCTAPGFNFLPIIRGFTAQLLREASFRGAAQLFPRVVSLLGSSGHPTSSSPTAKIWGDSSHATLVGGLQGGGLGQSSPLPTAHCTGTPALTSAPGRETQTPWKKHRVRTQNLLIRLRAPPLLVLEMTQKGTETFCFILSKAFCWI